MAFSIRDRLQKNEINCVNQLLTYVSNILIGELS